MTTIRQDPEYRVEHIKSVRNAGGSLSLTFEGGGGISIDRVAGIEPKPGDKVKLYGKGFGYVVRGVTINDKVVYYRTEAQQLKKAKSDLGKENSRQKQEFLANRAAMDEQFNALPDVFKKRIEGFRERNKDFRWKFEKYELFVCEEAVKIAAALKSNELIQQFSSANYEKQKEMVPGLEESHSGNTIEAATHFAFVFLSSPDILVLEHGALCPLVGCLEYGCWSATQIGEEK